MTNNNTSLDSGIDFPHCPICNSSSWETVYRGDIRDGAFGGWRDSEICRCGSCGVDRLAESACLGVESYQTTEYRSRLGQNHDADSHFAIHDELARFTLETLWPVSIRGKTVADVGCGGGALLDHLRGVATKILAIEPAIPFSDSLQERGYTWFPSAREAATLFKDKVDIVLSTQVIEHVSDPVSFLEDISQLLGPNGLAVISTPNRRDILMELLPDDFPQFFYRTQHRWSFDAGSLSKCAASAGLFVAEIRHVHRYGIANTMHWLKESKPRGRDPLGPLDGAIDKHWQAWLENNGRSDNLYIILRKHSAHLGEQK